MKNLHQKIAILGAGPAGLTAAEGLKTKGYHNITVFEKSDRAGGKCCSIQYQGRTFELGAGVFSKNNRTVLGLAKKFNVPVQQIDVADLYTSLLLDPEKGQPIPNRTLKYKLALLGEVFFTYRPLLKRYKKITQPGLQNLAADLCLPFAEFAAKHKIPCLHYEFLFPFTGFGYGFFEEVPAAYILKYLTPELFKSFLFKTIYEFPDGIQYLWETIADTNKVIYNCKVQKIQRTASNVTIQTANGEQTFDVLILACPLDESLQLLDASLVEQQLFSQISAYDYRTYACIVKGFPRKHGYFPGNLNSKRIGHPIAWYHRHHHLDLYAFYVFGDGKISDEAVLKNIQAAIQPFGGSLEKLHTAKHWKYFPHFTTEQMRQGHPDMLEGLQGRQNTFYVGELLNFSTVEYSAEYAQALVAKYF